MFRYALFFMILVIPFIAQGNEFEQIETASILTSDPDWDPEWNWIGADGEFHDLWLTGETDAIPMELPWWSAVGPAQADFNNSCDGCRDIYPADGWVCVFKDFGAENRPLPNFPRIILYNRFKGILRVFFYPKEIGGNTYTYAIVKLTHQFPATNATAMFTISDTTATQDYLDEFDPYKEEATICKYAEGVWCYAEFSIIGYDPDIPDGATFNFEIYGVIEEDIQLNGDVRIDQVLDDSNIGTPNGTNGLDAFKIIGSTYNNWKTLEDEKLDLRKKTDQEMLADGTKKGTHANEWWAATVWDLVKVGSTISDLTPALSVFSSVFDLIVGGGKTNQVQPLRFRGSLDIWGKIVNSQYINEFNIRVPGANHLENDNIPFYDKPLGIFNIRTKPIIKYHTDYKQVYCIEGTSYPTMKNAEWRHYQKLDDFEYVVNPFAGVVSKIEAAFVRNNDFPDFYEEGVSDGFIDIDLLKEKVLFVEHDLSYFNNPWNQCVSFNWSTIKLEKRQMALRLTIEPENSDPDYTPITIAKSFVPLYQSAPLSEFDGLSSLSGTINSNTTIIGNVEITGDITVTNNTTLSIDSGSVIFMYPNTNVIVESGSRIIANGTEQHPIKFKRYDISQQWDKIELRSDNNEFSWCVFDGGNDNIYVRGLYNHFFHCTFKNAGNYGFRTYTKYTGGWSSYKLNDCLIENNKYGLYSRYSYGEINNSTIRSNEQYGLYASSSRIGNNYSYGTKCGLFTNNYIHHNGTYGIYLSTDGILWMGYGYTSPVEGNNKIVNNQKHEIYLASSTSARMYGSHSGSTRGYSSIYDKDYASAMDNKYIYNLARTSDSESNWKVYAEYNFWGSDTGPQSGDFYGLVDYTPYLLEDPALYSGVYDVPMNSIDNPPNVDIVLTEGIVNSRLSGKRPTISSQEIIDANQQMLELRNKINRDINDSNNGLRLDELFRLLDQDPQKNIDEKKATDFIIAKYRDILLNKELVNDAGHLLNNKNSVKFIAEVAIVHDIYSSINDQKYEEALNKVALYEPYINNNDNRRELLSFKLSALEISGKYSEAYDVLRELKRVVKGTETWYTQPSYTDIERDLRLQLGLDPNIVEEEMFENNQADDESNTTPFVLHKNYPNPFNPTTNIPFALTMRSHVKIDIYDIQGRLVKSLTNKIYNQGNYNLVFDGSGLASSIYIVRAKIISIDKKIDKSYINKIMLLK